jgi:transcriptional regulator GlxA family with amidase domain
MQTDTINLCINDAKEYMQKNIEQDLTVEKVAAALHFSAPYFSKIFKDATGFSPYAYLINIRIEQAKKLLIQTTLPISLIANKVGFQSSENFIYCFKQKTNVSPLKFRKLRF